MLFAAVRNLAAWIGLVPKQHTTGGKDRLGGITKQGNRYLRWLLVTGAMAVTGSSRLGIAPTHANLRPIPINGKLAAHYLHGAISCESSWSQL
jgi:transposase